MKKILITILGVLLTIPEVAYAHAVGDSSGLMAGLSHPVLGLDHLLAMLSVGILSAQMGGKSIWKIPLAFVSIMFIGGILGICKVPIISVELGIALSVLVLGAAIASDKKLPSFLAIFFVGIFAIFHGHAHGTEMPSLAQPVLYACGFIIGTASIHIVGVWITFLFQKFKYGEQLLRFLGMGISGVGIYLLSA